MLEEEADKRLCSDECKLEIERLKSIFECHIHDEKNKEKVEEFKQELLPYIMAIKQIMQDMNFKSTSMLGDYINSYNESFKKVISLFSNNFMIMCDIPFDSIIKNFGEYIDYRNYNTIDELRVLILTGIHNWLKDNKTPQVD